MNSPELPPLYRDQCKVDADHLKLLAVFHFVLAGLSVVGLLFLFLHWSLMNAAMAMAEKQPGKGGPPPAEFFAIFKWFYLFMGVMIVIAGITNLLSGRCIQQRRGRIFSLIVAGLNCLAFPFGTCLGVFTFIVLLRDSVIQAYEANRGT
jgi:hypothetical protein